MPPEGPCVALRGGLCTVISSTSARSCEGSFCGWRLQARRAQRVYTTTSTAPPRFGTRLSHQGPDLWLAEGPWPTSPESLEPSAVTVRSSGCRRCGRLVLQGPSLPMSPAETLRLAGCLPAQPHHQGYWKAARLQRSLRLVKENCLGVSVLHLGGVLRTLGRPWGQASRGCWTQRHRQGSPVSPGREG